MQNFYAVKRTVQTKTAPGSILPGAVSHIQTNRIVSAIKSCAM